MRDERFESIARVTPFVPQNKLDRPDGPVLNVEVSRALELGSRVSRKGELNISL